MKVSKLKKQEILFGGKRDEGKQSFSMKIIYACVIPVVESSRVKARKSFVSQQGTFRAC